MCLGFAMPDNFRFPYAAIGFSDFWRRWHITLSAWLRDYLYIPLGGNRHGEVRTYFSLIATMLLGGLWHGASWTFVAWGGLHGAYLSAERVLRLRFARYRPGPFALLGLGLLTFFLIQLTWVFFPSEDIYLKPASFFSRLISINAAPTAIIPGIELLLAWSRRIRPRGCSLANAHTNTYESMLARVPVPLFAATWAALAFAIIIEQGSGNALHLFPVLTRAPLGFASQPRIGPASPNRSLLGTFRQSLGRKFLSPRFRWFLSLWALGNGACVRWVSRRAI